MIQLMRIVQIDRVVCPLHPVRHGIITFFSKGVVLRGKNIRSRLVIKSGRLNLVILFAHQVLVTTMRE